MYSVFAIKSNLISNIMGSDTDVEKQIEEPSGGWHGEGQGERKRVTTECLGLVSVMN